MVTLERRTVTVREAAALLGVGRDTAYAAVRDGTLPSIRLGKRLVIPMAALEKMLADAGQKDA
jgi:excisionase family DNA binding protein